VELQTKCQICKKQITIISTKQKIKEKSTMDKTKQLSDNTPHIHRLLKAEEVAELLNISHSFAYLLMQTGQIPTVRLGRACRVKPQDLAEYIEKNIQG
jgi:excisionase family DNA binding protein